jgi:hypothetical protein
MAEVDTEFLRLVALHGNPILGTMYLSANNQHRQDPTTLAFVLQRQPMLLLVEQMKVEDQLGFAAHSELKL